MCKDDYVDGYTLRRRHANRSLVSSDILRSGPLKYYRFVSWCGIDQRSGISSLFFRSGAPLGLMIRKSCLTLLYFIYGGCWISIDVVIS